MWERLLRRLGLLADYEEVPVEEPPRFVFQTLSMTPGALAHLSKDQKAQLAELDRVATHLHSLIQQGEQGHTLDQWRALGVALQESLQTLQKGLASAALFVVADDLSLAGLPRRAQDLITAIQIHTQPLIQPSDGCKLVAIVDTETTGLANFDEPITVAVILVEVSMPKGDLVRVVESYYGQRQPGIPISAGAFQVHGLRLADLQGKAFDRLRLELLLRSAQLVVAHNAKFDRRMLRHVLLNSDGLPWACSMLALRDFWDGWADGRSLDAICRALGVERANPHNALTDAQALLAVLQNRTGKTKRSRTLLGQLIWRPWCPPPSER